MITLPKPFATVPSCPGYFWNTENHKLYSIKMAGELRELKMNKVNSWTFKRMYRSKAARFGDEYYTLSVQGKPRCRLVKKLKKLKCVDYEIPMHPPKETV
jgi:hypothetical protein